MADMMKKAKEFVGRHGKQVDQGIKKAGQQADKRTKGKYSEQISRGVAKAQEQARQRGQGR